MKVPKQLDVESFLIMYVNSHFFLMSIGQFNGSLDTKCF